MQQILKILINNFEFKLVRLSLVFVLILIVISTILSNNSVYAASPSFSVTPNSGYVKVGTDFVFDIKVDSAGNTLNLARVVLTYDPMMVKIVKAEKNSAIFCSWPEDQQTVDNVNGVLMVTAFCQSGNTGVYKTVGESDVLARITMRALKAGSVDFKWQWTGEDQAFKSVLIEDGSPPQNLLSPAPLSFRFIAALITTPSNPTTPKTGIFETETYIIAGIVFGAALLIFGGTTLLLMTNKRMINKKFKTLVIYEDEEEL